MSCPRHPDTPSGERVEDREFELDERNRAPRGVWSDRKVLRVSDSGQEKLFAHDLETGERLPERDLALTERNRDARGIRSNGKTMWCWTGGRTASLPTTSGAATCSPSTLSTPPTATRTASRPTG